MDEASVRVARGVTLLDKVCPDWPGRVDGDRLSMDSMSCCVLGQIYGQYSYGVHRLGLSVVEAIGHGFDLPCTDESVFPSWRDIELAWDELTAEWRRAIAARRA